MLSFGLLLGLAGSGFAAGPNPSNVISMAPPPTVGGPVMVSLGFWMQNLSSIDEVTGRFEISGYLEGKWHDQRLRFTPANPADKIRYYKVGEVWQPAFEFVNGVTPRSRYDTEIRVEPDGLVHYVERCSATLSSRFRLRTFPFDTQVLEIIVRPFIAEAGRTLFTSYDERIGTNRESFDSLAQWELLGIKAQAGRGEIDNTRRWITEVRFDITVKRKFNYYIWKVFLPLLLMVILSWTVFLIDPSDLDNQVQISVTTILTVIAFAFAISASLPKVPYLTFIDGFFLACYVFVFLSVVELMSVHVLQRAHGTEAAMRIRRNSRWMLPLAFLIVNAILIPWFFLRGGHG